MIKIKIKKSNEKLVGGAGDNKPDSSFDQGQLNIGIEDETGEHTKDKQIGKEIAKDHLSKDPDYYRKLKSAGIEEKRSRKLSEYWRSRAKRRARNAGRSWINKTDYNWALEEQSKSASINNSIHNLFEKELQTNEEINGVVQDLLEKLKKNKQKKDKLKVKNFGPGTPQKSNKSISKKYPPHKKGETVGGYYRKVSKKMGGATAAPGEAIGPQE